MIVKQQRNPCQSKQPMLTLLIIAMLSWSCGESSNAKKALEIDQEQEQITLHAFKQHDDESEIESTRTLDQEVAVKDPSRAKMSDHSIHLQTPTFNVLREATKPVQATGKVEEEPESLENETLRVDTAATLSDHVVTLAVPDHSAFSELLSKYVDAQGKVNYSGLKSEVTKLDSYLTELKQQQVDDSWSREEKLAYWINTYNAFTIKLILNNYPISSITELEGGKPWDKKWITLGDKTYSLNQIENDIIRPQFGEPRIHFAVNCAAKSCPPLADKAFTADNLEGLLESQTRKFINNVSYNKIATNQAQVSKIFDWYGSDFGNVVSFLNKYSEVKIAPMTNVEFLEYNWKLNN
jgi:hypothetical protein